MTRALEIQPTIALYMQAVWSKRLLHPGNKSFEVVSAAVKDKLLKAKPIFFMAMAEMCHPFLEVFQTETCHAFHVQDTAEGPHAQGHQAWGPEIISNVIQ